MPFHKINGSITARRSPGTAIVYRSVAVIIINVKNFHRSITTVVRAQNDTSETANITDIIFDRT